MNRVTRVIAGVVGTSFIVTLVLLASQWLGDEAKAALAGSICGVVASIPTSLLVVWWTRRRRGQARCPTSGPTT